MKNSTQAINEINEVISELMRISANFVKEYKGSEKDVYVSEHYLYLQRRIEHLRRKKLDVCLRSQ
jgi:hypothetical protein